MTSRSERAVEQEKVAETEGELRELPRQEAAPMRGGRGEVAELGANSINAVIARVAGTSMQDIDNLIHELQTVREILRSEGERVQREIAGYAHLSQAARKSTKVIADSVTQWKSAVGEVRRVKG
jgi:hypothetical protein